MGVNLDDAKLLTGLSRDGVSFGDVLTLGRQQIFFDPAELATSLSSSSFDSAKVERFVKTAKDGGVVDPLLELCGARSITALDFSDYQGASIRHDLNSPIPNELRERYDLVLDGGTLEHVFHFPTGLKSAMEMTKVGGSLVILTIANNQVGHGFYQFSPELFYRVFHDANGFRVSSLRAVELSPAHKIYEVVDPATVRSRVTLSGAWPVNLFVHAIRTSVKPVFAQSPQQSDYVALWQESNGTDVRVEETRKTPGGLRSGKRIVARLFPRIVYFLATFKRIFLDIRLGLANPKFYKRIKE